jgi:hypothetical protein
MLAGATVRGRLRTPTPLIKRARLAFDAELVNVIFPPVQPAVPGEKVTEKVVL